MAIESWLPVPSKPGLLASSLGRIMIAPYKAPLPNGGLRKYGGIPTYGVRSGNRRIYVHKGHSLKVHRLVCEAFKGPAPELSVCMHLDENSDNNKPENLMWGTQKENLNAPGFLAYCRLRIGINSPASKLRQAN